MGRTQRVVTFVLAVVLAAGATQVIGAAPAGATVVGGHTLTFNMYGMNGSSQEFNEPVAQGIIDSLDNRDPFPLVVTLQETCRSQYDAVAAYLSPLGYSGAVFYGQTVGGVCGWFGTVIFTVGATSATIRTPTTQAGTETRGAVCWNANHGWYLLFACGMHLQPSNTTVASAQLVDIVQWAGPTAGSRIAILAGDLNLDTHPDRSGYWSGLTALVWPFGYVEAGTASQPLPLSTLTTMAPGETERKLDYIWVESIATPSQVATRRISPYSDHRIYELHL